MPDIDLARRRFLRGGRPIPDPVRPPWSVQRAFTDLCTRCGACVAACGPGPLTTGDGGFPAMDFGRGECSFCAACAEACPEPLFLPRTLPPWRLRAEIGSGCLAAGGTYCRSCGDACPAGAIRFAVRLGGRADPAVAADACTGCGACVSACPAGVVRVAAAEALPGEALSREAGHGD